jgi:hypothetical protein
MAYNTKDIVSNKDPKFRSNFWKGLFKGFGTKLNLSISYHPESDGKKKKDNIIIEDMLRMYMMDQLLKGEDYIHLVEFAYNNGYQASLKMIPLESVYGRKCNTPLSWDNPIYKSIIGLELLKEKEEKMVNIRKNLKDFQDRNFFYGDKNRDFKDFKVGEHVFIKVKSKISSIILGYFPKLTTRYCGPFEILENIGPVEYMLSIPSFMRVHNVFHM